MMDNNENKHLQMFRKYLLIFIFCSTYIMSIWYTGSIIVADNVFLESGWLLTGSTIILLFSRYWYNRCKNVTPQNSTAFFYLFLPIISCFLGIMTISVYYIIDYWVVRL